MKVVSTWRKSTPTSKLALQEWITFERLIGRGLVIQGEQNPRDDLQSEQEDRHSAQEVKGRTPVDRHLLLGGQRFGHLQAQPFVQIGPTSPYQR
jgi:hypothetical protein